MDDRVAKLQEKFNESEKFLVRSSIADQLGRIGDEEAVKVLIDALKDEEEVYVRARIVKALTSVGSEAVEPLINELSNDNKYVYFTKAYKLMKADKKGILWDERFVKAHGLIISDSGRYIFGKGFDRNLLYKIILLNNKGKIVWEKYTQNMGVSFEKCVFDDKEEHIFAVGTRGRKFAILRVPDGNVLENIPWCKPGSPIYKRLWGYPASLTTHDSKIAIAVSSDAVKRKGDLLVALYDISHLIK